MKRALLSAAAAALCLLAACTDPGPSPSPDGNLVSCEGDACFYDDGTEK